MTNRERTMNILHYRDADRLPAIHFGCWDELLVEWAEQGHISMDMAKNMDDDGPVMWELNEMLGWDYKWFSCPSYHVTNWQLYPPFEEKVLETLPSGHQRIQNAMGLIERIKPGVASIPSEDDYQLKDREAFEALYKPKMQFTTDRFDSEYLKNYNEEIYNKTDRPLGIQVGSIIGDIRNMTSVLGLSYLMYDEDEDLLADIVDTYADMQYKMTEAFLKSGAKFDYAHYWEDICFKNGPLVSPSKFEELCGKHYRKRNELLHSYGIDIIALDTDGVTELLQPTWIESGVNVLFPIEYGTWGDQFEAARKRFGKRQLGIGGFNKLALREDKAAVDKEIERVRRLVDMGGYIPCPDHGLMPGTKFELVQYYTDQIKSIKL